MRAPVSETPPLTDTEIEILKMVVRDHQQMFDGLLEVVWFLSRYICGASMRCKMLDTISEIWDVYQCLKDGLTVLIQR